MITMIIKQITIHQLGNIPSLSCNFGEGVNLIGTRHTSEVCYALSLVLNNRAMPPFPPQGICEASRVEALVNAQEKTFHLIVTPTPRRPILHAYDEHQNDITRNYMYLTRHHEEQDLSDIFNDDRSARPPNLLRFAPINDFSTAKDLSKHTDGISDTPAFRAYLRSFMEHFKPEYIRQGKKYMLALTDYGQYDVIRSDHFHCPILLSESEERLFRYLCFLRTAEFWHGFEQIRNLHSIQKPLVIQNFLEHLDESIDLSDIIRRTVDLQRQVIFVTLPNILTTKGNLWDTFLNGMNEDSTPAVTQAITTLKNN